MERFGENVELDKVMTEVYVLHISIIYYSQAHVILLLLAIFLGNNILNCK